VLTINRAFDLLEAFLKAKGEIGIVELAALSGLSVGVAHRIATALIKRGYLKQTSKRGKYSLSPKVLQFSKAIKQSFNIEDSAYPFMIELNEASGETVNLAILDDYEAVGIESIDSKEDLRFSITIGRRMPLHSTAVGKIFLAFMTDEEQLAFLNNKELSRYTAKTTTDFNALKNELIAIKQEGVAMDNEENGLGVSCIGAPIKARDGKVLAAISMSVPSVRFTTDRIPELKSLVRNCARQISQAMGETY